MALEANLYPVWADEVLRERRGSLTAGQLRDLTLLATGDAQAAEDAWLARAEEDMRAGRTPDGFEGEQAE